MIDPGVYTKGSVAQAIEILEHTRKVESKKEKPDGLVLKNLDKALLKLKAAISQIEYNDSLPGW